MHFDAMVRTALALEPGATAWRQLVDIVAQGGTRVDRRLLDEAIGSAGSMRDAVPRPVRAQMASAVASRTNEPALVALFADDDVAIAAPVLAGARLRDDAWIALLPALSPAARSVVRGRRDLSAAVRQALAAYGSTDFALPPVAGIDAGGADAQIRELVARIESFRQRHPAIAPDTAPAEDAATAFVFETSVDGTIDWLSAVARNAVLGIGIGEPASDGGYGVDGQAAGAFRRRAPFRDARLTIAGTGPAAGEWRIGGSPIFDPRTGRFTGYRGHARRPRPDETAAPVARLAGTSLPVDSVRQLVHELRTPLNAVLGFADMIGRQVLGPAAAPYRVRAESIVSEAEALMALIDDLDLAARPGVAGSTELSLHDVINQVEVGLLTAAADRDAYVTTDTDTTLTVTGIDAATLERMLTRLGAGLVAMLERHETLSIVAAERGDGIAVALSRPRRLAALDDAALLDPPNDGRVDAASLGLAFTLRLMTSMARAAGQGFEILPDAFRFTFARAVPLSAGACS